MSRPSPPGFDDDEASVEALTVAMALAPGVYARNRMFGFFAKSGVLRAKSRAATLRGIVRHLPRARALSLTTEGASRDQTGVLGYVLRYQIPAMRLARVVELSPTELAALRLLAARSGVAVLGPSDADRDVVVRALARLLGPVADADGLARVAEDVARAAESACHVSDEEA